MNIEPYVGVGDFSFGQTIEHARLKFGEPLNEDETRNGQSQLHYESFIVRFDAETNLFKEFTALPGCELTLRDKKVPWNIEFLKDLHHTDPELVELYGFIVSFKNGISVSGFHDGDEAGKAIHVFQRDVWKIEPDDDVLEWHP